MKRVEFADSVRRVYVNRKNLTQDTVWFYLSSRLTGKLRSLMKWNLRDSVLTRLEKELGC